MDGKFFLNGKLCNRSEMHAKDAMHSNFCVKHTVKNKRKYLLLHLVL